MIRLVLAEDQALVRGALAALLGLETDLQVVAEAGDGEAAWREVRAHAPDLLVTDIEMPGLTGLDVALKVQEAGLATRVVIITTFARAGYLRRAMDAGVRGYLLKDMEPDEVIGAIGRAARGEMVVAPAMTLKLAQMLQSGAKGDTRSSQFASLTERERQILEHLSRGQSNKTIARALDISHDTVKLHVRHILSKLGLSSRVEAAVFAVEFRGTPAGAAQAGEPARKPAR